MYIEKYLYENIKTLYKKKTESIKIHTMCKKCILKKMLDF